MERFTGLLGMLFILGIAWAFSTNRKKINIKTVGIGLGLQVVLGLFVLKTEIGHNIFAFLGHLVNKLLEFTNEGSHFVFGALVPASSNEQGALGMIFAFQVLPAIIFVGSLLLRHYAIHYQSCSQVSSKVYEHLWRREPLRYRYCICRPERSSPFGSPLLREDDPL